VRLLKILFFGKRLWRLGLMCLLCTSCNVSKKLKPGEYLVNSYEIVDNKTNIDKENLEAFIRQKPNRKFLRFIHFYVWWYNLFEDSCIQQRKAKRNAKYDIQNAKRLEKYRLKKIEREKKAKHTKEPQLKDKERLLFRENLRNIGEPAVIYDSALTAQTRIQLQKYLFQKGYFNNDVKDTVFKEEKTKKAKVKYYITPRKAYFINSIRYTILDEKVATYIYKDSMHTLLKVGRQYDAEVLQKERERITTHLMNNGYFYYENAFTYFNVDTNFKDHTVSIVLVEKKFPKTFSSSNDSIIYVNHSQYTIDKVYMITELFAGKLEDAFFKDTVRVPNNICSFLTNTKLNYRAKVLASYIEFEHGELFQRDKAERIYKRLLNLGIFRSVSIRFVKSSNVNKAFDAYIICVPLIKQSMAAETEGTNTSGNLGIDGSLIYQNRNFFRGGELVEIKMQGAILAQRLLSAQDVNATSLGLNDVQSTFNTIQFGPHANFSVPRAFFPFSLFKFKHEAAPRTFINSSLNYQRRPDFGRVISSINYGLTFKSNRGILKHEIIPFEGYVVRANLTSSFRNQLLALNDFFLLNSFIDHLTTLSKYALSYNSQVINNSSKKTVSYFKVDIMSSGNILRGLYNITGQPKDTAGRYQLFKIPFAQFLRGDIDYRLYIPIRNKSRVVYRGAFGIGKPLSNLSVLPYEQSFFGGGTNSVRAWRARTLGPGGYAQPDSVFTRFDKIGNILIEGNAEYRFHIIKSFYGALFADAGNIWLLEKDITKPRGEFKIDYFINQFAFGGGLGIRWDLNFFVVRLDLAMPLKDPSFEEGNRWQIDKKPWNRTVANFGIGYPF
jgi:outer membrane protein assembly factor BamA